MTDAVVNKARGDAGVKRLRAVVATWHTMSVARSAKVRCVCVYVYVYVCVCMCVCVFSAQARPGRDCIPRKWEFQQRRGDGALRSDCQHARPLQGPVPNEQAEPGGCFGAKKAADFGTEQRRARTNSREI